MNSRQREHVTSSLYDALVKLQQAGKNENMCKNAYIKFMCWLYYRFERIVNQLGEEKVSLADDFVDFGACRLRHRASAVSG